MVRKLVGTSLVMLILALAASRASADTFEGKVAVAGAAKLTVVTKAGENREFSTSSTTKIKLDGKPAKLADIEVGDVVKIVADKQGDELVAKEIEARSAE